MRLLLLDSGAFSCWSRGITIDFDAYIDFCVERPWVSYYVNLDVIPGKPNKATRADDIKAACQASWDNYQKMLKRLPFEKVVPVFHQSDGWEWLEKYIEFGTPYIGISPANDRTTDQKLQWLKDCKPYLFQSDGTPVIKTHGFAVTSFRLMKAMQWHSVDSASWVKQSAYGTIYIPMVKGGEFVYDRSPFLLSVSPKSPSRDERQQHITTLSPTIKSQVDRYLKGHLKMGLGTFEVIDVPSGYKKQDGELWWDKKKTQVLRVLEKGLMTCHQQRFWANMKFMQKANRVLPVDHIYFAGAGGSLLDQIEFRLGRRLMSYHEVVTSKSAGAVFERYAEHLQAVA